MASTSSSPTSPPPPTPPSGLSRLPHLLPLLPSPPTARDALEPPLHLLPNGEVRPSRIVHRQPPSAGGGPAVEWISTTHIYPAAYPRSHPASTCPPCALGREERDEELLASATGGKAQEAELRKRDLQRWDAIKARYAGSGTGGLYDCPETEEEAEERAKELVSKAFPQLWSTAQRIVPVEVPGGQSRPQPAMGRGRKAKAERAAVQGEEDEEEEQGYTLILAHANGFHKETFEPTLRSLLDSLQTQRVGKKRIHIDEIWSLDSLGAGEGGPLVRETVGEVFSWFDAARDIEQLVSRCLPEKGEGGRGKEWGPRWPKTQLSSRAPRSGGSGSGNGKGRRRRFIGVGHSVSGAAMAILAGCRPGLFDAVVLIDPVTAHKDNFSTALTHPYTGLSHPAAQGAIVRRHTWLNRSAAAAYFASRPFFQAWNKEVLENFTRFCLRPLSGVKGGGGAVTLATSRWSEANVFASSAVGCFALAALIYGGARPTSATPDDEHDLQPTTATPTPTKIWHLSASLPRSVQTEKDTLAIEEAIRRGVVEGRFGEGSGYERLDEVGADHLVVQQQPDFVGKKLAMVLGRLLGGDGEQQSFKPPGARL